MGILDFINQYVDIGQLLSGIIAIALGVLIFRSNGKSFSNDKFAIRLVTVALLTIGAYLLFISIRTVDDISAATIAFTVLFVGSVWSMGAEKITATIVGLILGLISFLILLSLVSTLPSDSWIGHLLTDWGNTIRHLFNIGKDRTT